MKFAIQHNRSEIADRCTATSWVGRRPSIRSIDPLPDDYVVVGNIARHNGGDADELIAPLPGSDLLWDLSGSGNAWTKNVFATSFPDPLPAGP